jgi:hypothetical protein
VVLQTKFPFHKLFEILAVPSPADKCEERKLS